MKETVKREDVDTIQKALSETSVAGDGMVSNSSGDEGWVNARCFKSSLNTPASGDKNGVWGPCSGFCSANRAPNGALGHSQLSLFTSQKEEERDALRQGAPLGHDCRSPPFRSGSAWRWKELRLWPSCRGLGRAPHPPGPRALSRPQGECHCGHSVGSWWQ